MPFSVRVVLAVYRPDPDHFETQIRSLAAQTHPPDLLQTQESLHTASSHLTAPGPQLLNAWLLAPLLPAEVFQRPKRGFSVPLGEWFRGPLRELAEDALLSLGRRGFLREAAVRSVLERHLRGPYDRGDQVYALVALETWCRTYLDRTEVDRSPLS